MNHPPLENAQLRQLLHNYQQLLEEIDSWFSRCSAQFPTQIECGKGCSACCRGLFEISLLDAALLQQGLRQLSPNIQQAVLHPAERRLAQLQQQWPELQHPYILNQLPHDHWQEMPEDDPTPCVLLDDQGSCLLYRQRPMLCRLHGLPNIDSSGEIFQADSCSLNFTAGDATEIQALRHPFHQLYRREFDLLGEFSTAVLGQRNLEIDTFIPLALLIEFSRLNAANNQ